MRAAILASVCLLLAGCASRQSPPAEGGLEAQALAGFTACGAYDGVLPTEDTAIKMMAGRVQRHGRTLRIGSLALKDNLEEGGAYAEYRYVGRLAGAPLDLVHIAQYEGEDWMAVDDAGRTTVLGGVPVVGPDHSLLAIAANGEPHTSSLALVFGLGPNGLTKLFETEIYPPCGGRWENADRFGFSTYTEFLDGPTERKLAPAALVREGGVWRYEGLKPVG